MTAGRLLIRAEGGQAEGSGHIARCFALAEAWRDRGGSATLVADEVPALWRARCAEASVAITAVVDAASATGSWVVLDGYQFGPSDQDAWRARGGCLLIIDDHGRAGRWPAALVLDQNLGADPADYGPPDGRPPLLLGPRYALLRSEFRGGPRPAQPAGRVAVAAGGLPTPVVRQFFDEIDRGLVEAGIEVVRIDGLADVAGALRTVDLAVSAAGGATWEIASLGLPMVLVPVADNQVPVARHLVARGAAVRPLTAGDDESIRSGDPGVVVREALALAGSPDRRRAMAAAAAGLVDGLGAVRVVTRMLASGLVVRRVTPADTALLFGWANDRAVRAEAFSSAAIGWDDHVAWLTERLADPTGALYIGSDDEGPVGHVRFAAIDGGVEISVLVAPERRGDHLGAALIDAGVRRVCAELAPGMVLARVKPTNVASQRAFTAADFDAAGSGSGEGHDWLRYTRPGARPGNDHGG